MEEVNVYKYLGIKLGNNRIFGYQMDGDVKKIGGGTSTGEREDAVLEFFV